jgi:hypothetical protein
VNIADTTFADDDTIVLVDSAAGVRRFAFLLAFGGLACVVYGTTRGLISLQSLGAAALVGAALMWSRRLWWHNSVILNPAGLCVLRRRRVIALIPADAIREVILAEAPSGSLQLRLRYDTKAVPEPPPEIRDFADTRRALGRATPADVIPLGRVGSDPAALTLQKTFRIHRLVDDRGLGEWRQIDER